MHEIVKSLQLKDYNPCGDLTGRERQLCNEAATNFQNLPFVEVMRAVAVKVVAELDHEKVFPNEAALVDWAMRELNKDEWHVVVAFDESSTLQVGLSKYLAHVMYENRYNIHYNALVNYCRTLDEKVFGNALTAEQLERKIDELAKQADTSTTVNALIDKLLNFVKGSQSKGLLGGVVSLIHSFK